MIAGYILREKKINKNYFIKLFFKTIHALILIAMYKIFSCHDVAHSIPKTLIFAAKGSVQNFVDAVYNFLEL